MNLLMPTHVGNKLFMSQYIVIHIDFEILHFGLCNVHCREGVRSTLVDLGGSSRGGYIRGYSRDH